MSSPRKYHSNRITPAYAGNTKTANAAYIGEHKSGASIKSAYINDIKDLINQALDGGGTVYPQVLIEVDKNGESRLYDIVGIKERSAGSSEEHNLGRQTKLQRNDYNDDTMLPSKDGNVKQNQDLQPLAEVFGQYDDDSEEDGKGGFMPNSQNYGRGAGAPGLPAEIQQAMQARGLAMRNAPPSTQVNAAPPSASPSAPMPPNMPTQQPNNPPQTPMGQPANDIPLQNEAQIILSGMKQYLGHIGKAQEQSLKLGGATYGI